MPTQSRTFKILPNQMCYFSHNNRGIPSYRVTASLMNKDERVEQITAFNCFPKRASAVCSFQFRLAEHHVKRFIAQWSSPPVLVSSFANWI